MNPILTGEILQGGVYQTRPRDVLRSSSLKSLLCFGCVQQVYPCIIQ